MFRGRIQSEWKMRRRSFTINVFLVLLDLFNYIYHEPLELHFHKYLIDIHVPHFTFFFVTGESQMDS